MAISRTVSDDLDVTSDDDGVIMSYTGETGWIIRSIERK